MVSIARSSLIYEWRRYLAAILAVTFAGLLIVVQLALLLGMFRTVSIPVDLSDAQLWIGFRNTQSIDLGRIVTPGSDARAWMHPDVDRVERFLYVYGDLRRNDGIPISVMVNGIDTSPKASAFNKLLTDEQRALLKEPNTILIDEADMDKLGAHNNTLVEINGKSVRIAGTVRGIRTIGGVTVLASFATTATISPETLGKATFYLIRLHTGASAPTVKGQLESQGALAKYSVWEAPDFSLQSQIYWLLESGSGIGSGFASLLALIVGIVITSQTLSAAAMASIKEFAALRALGVSRKELQKVVLEQSCWIGLTGLVLTALLTTLFYLAGESAYVALAFPWWMLAGTAGSIMLIAMGSGLLSLKPLLSAEPASLLR